MGVIWVDSVATFVAKKCEMVQSSLKACNTGFYVYTYLNFYQNFHIVCFLTL